MHSLPQTWMAEACQLHQQAAQLMPVLVQQDSAPIDPIHRACWYSCHYQLRHSPVGLFREYHRDDLQLPEPFSGTPSDAEIAVIGQNPGYRFDESIPRLGTMLEDYVEFYDARFSPSARREGKPGACYSGSWKAIRHYVEIERVVGQGALGARAVYLDAIPWKWGRWSAAGQALKPPHWKEMQAYARARVSRLVGACPGIRITLVIGADAADLCGAGPRPSTASPAVWATAGAICERPTLLMMHPGSWGTQWTNSMANATPMLNDLLGCTQTQADP